MESNVNCKRKKISKNVNKLPPQGSMSYLVEIHIKYTQRHQKVHNIQFETQCISKKSEQNVSKHECHYYNNFKRIFR